MISTGVATASRYLMSATNSPGERAGPEGMRAGEEARVNDVTCNAGRNARVVAPGRGVTSATVTISWSSWSNV